MAERNSTRAPILNQAKKMGRRPMTTEQFIEKAKAVHGDTYGYDLVFYVKNSIKVDIECKLHGVFSQAPQHHVRGRGCPECARLAKITKRRTLAQFIAEAEAVHGKGRYDYSMAVYKGSKHKVKLKCNVCHTVFEQVAQSHLSGSKCSKCSYKSRTIAQEEFVQRCIDVHGIDKYDYSRTEYKGSENKVTVYCKACDDYFEQTAYVHVRGSNCPRCVNRKKASNTDEFIEKAIAVHGKKYSYDSVNYVNKREKVTIHCASHGYFSQTPNIHLSGSGCMQCHIEGQRYSKSEFVSKAREVHGNTYSYENAEYTTNKDRILITCKVHGDYWQAPSDHIQGNGCPDCNKGRLGYGRTEFERLCQKNNEGQGIFYLIRCQGNGEAFYKIGITSRSVSKRFSRIDQFPYSYEALFEVTANPDFVYDLENRVKNILAGYSYKPLIDFKGYTECFDEIPQAVISMIKRMESDSQLQLIA